MHDNLCLMSMFKIIRLTDVNSEEREVRDAWGVNVMIVNQKSETMTSLNCSVHCIVPNLRILR